MFVPTLIVGQAPPVSSVFSSLMSRLLTPCTSNARPKHQRRSTKDAEPRNSHPQRPGSGLLLAMHSC